MAKRRRRVVNGCRPGLRSQLDAFGVTRLGRSVVVDHHHGLASAHQRLQLVHHRQLRNQRGILGCVDQLA